MKSRRTMWPYLIGAVALAFFAIFYFFKSSFGYDTIGNQVVYKYYDNVNYKRATRQMPNAEASTFVAFGPHKEYGKDASDVFIRGINIPGADPNTFEIINKRNKYARDKNNVYCYIKKISDRSDHFEYLKFGFAKDDQFVFHKGDKLVNADPVTFEFSDEKGYLTKDAQNIYMNGKLLEGAHSPSFENISFHYYRDKSHVYHRQKLVTGAKPKTIKVLDDRYAKDAFFVYYESNRILDADPVTFEVIAGRDGDFYAQDKYRKYWYGKVVEEFPERLTADAN